MHVGIYDYFDEFLPSRYFIFTIFFNIDFNLPL